MTREEVLKFLEENECVAIAKFPDGVQQAGIEKNTLLRGTALRLFYTVMSSSDTFVIVNVQHSPDYMDKISKITTALGCEYSVVSNAETVTKMAEKEWYIDSWSNYGNMGKWAIYLKVKNFMEARGLSRQ